MLVDSANFSPALLQARRETKHFSRLLHSAPAGVWVFPPTTDPGSIQMHNATRGVSEAPREVWGRGRLGQRSTITFPSPSSDPLRRAGVQMGSDIVMSSPLTGLKGTCVSRGVCAAAVVG